MILYIVNQHYVFINTIIHIFLLFILLNSQKNSENDVPGLNFLVYTEKEQNTQQKRRISAASTSIGLLISVSQS